MPSEKELANISTLKDVTFQPHPMSQPNEILKIFEGNFELKNEEYVITIKGVVSFKWFPYMGLYFEGYEQKKTALKEGKTNLFNQEFLLVINNEEIGKIAFNSQSINVSGNYYIGHAIDKACYHDGSIPVNSITFSIPNLRVLSGGLVSYGYKNTSGSWCRLKFDDEKYEIIIDQVEKIKDSIDKLTASGGFFFTYGGEIRAKSKRSVSLSQLNETILKFSNFISFLNGRSLSLLLLKGIHENEVIWTDYSSRIIEPYQYVQSWTARNNSRSEHDFNEIYKNFSELWKNDKDKDFLIALIHWYCEANSISARVEGSIIIIQTALELLYNWLIIDKLSILKEGRDTESFSAANKIRLLLTTVKIDVSVPQKLSSLQAFIDSNENLIDAPDAIVKIRNSIVHSNVKNLQFTDDILTAKYEALQLAIYYVERSLLYILKYNGNYSNRITKAIEALK